MTSFGTNIGGMTWCKGVLYGRDVDGSSSKVATHENLCGGAFSDGLHFNVQFDIVSHLACIEKFESLPKTMATVPWL